MPNPAWSFLLLSTPAIWAQSNARPLPASRDRDITFSNTKPVLGLPLDSNRKQGLCSSDGLTYFDSHNDPSVNARVLDLYSVTTTGEVRHLSRTVPLDYTNALNRDFFPGDAALVTLIEAQKRDANDPDRPPRETQFYLAVSDHDGDQSKLLALDVPFKPYKVAQFGTGEFAVLGWEEANQLAQLAILKEDGTLRRFVDLEERPPGSQSKAAPAPPATRDLLAGAAFVPFGRRILLTYPGTARPIRILSGSGIDSLSLQFPPGYQLHDVLNPGFAFTLVARVQELSNLQPGKKDDEAPPRQRMFEFSAQTGARIREFTFDNVPISAVTCAANRSLAAIFEQPADPAPTPDKPAPPAQLVVSTVSK